LLDHQFEYQDVWERLGWTVIPAEGVWTDALRSALQDSTGDPEP
jgi:hypothetical protein